MSKLWVALLLVGLAGLIACRNDQDVQETAEVTIVAVSGESAVVSLDELSANPAAYEGAYLEVTGEFRRLPVLICENDPHRSPAQWGIASDDHMALAGGFNSQLRAVVPDGLIVTVAGRWQQWQGSVGCGDDTTFESIWYLAVERIISPTSFARITLTPAFVPGASEGGQQSATPLSTGFTITDTMLTDTAGTPIASLTPTTPSAAGTATIPVTPQGAPTATRFDSGTPTVAIGATASVTPTSITSTPTAVSGTVSPTPAATGSPTPTSIVSATATGTATATGPTPTQSSLATATPTVVSASVIDKGTISGEELATEQLGANELHVWNFSISANDAITVSVAASPSINVVVSIVDGVGNRITERNAAPAGLIEQIANLPLTEPGDYQIQIRALDGASGHYSVILLLRDSFPFVAQSILAYGASQSGSLAANSDHFWFFQGNAGDSVSITVIPGDSGDLFLELYGTDATDLAGFIDDGISGEQEQLADFLLPDTGLYAIRVGEYDFLPSVYQIILAGG